MTDDMAAGPLTFRISWSDGAGVVRVVTEAAAVPFYFRRIVLGERVVSVGPAAADAVLARCDACGAPASCSLDPASGLVSVGATRCTDGAPLVLWATVRSGGVDILASDVNTRPALAAAYDAAVATASDINEHLGALRALARRVCHVTEWGVRGGVSSLAFLLGLSEAAGVPASRAPKLVGVDLAYLPNVGDVSRLAAENGVDYVFIAGSDLLAPREATDMLFIDTFHVYGQLRRELARMHSFVRRFIVMHDTTVDAAVGEAVRSLQGGWLAKWDEADARAARLPYAETIVGLWPAVEEFLASNTDWVLRERYTHNNGLTVLERVRGGLTEEAVRDVLGARM